MKIIEDAKIKDLKGKISGGSRLELEIAYYQRPYKWPAIKITDLFNDYYENKNKANNNEELEYFLGAIVLITKSNEKEKSEGIWKYQVVDGQQRLTTLFLFNYLKYLLLINKADSYIERKNMGLYECLKEIEECYGGFIGKNKIQSIVDANKKLKTEMQKAVDEQRDIDNKARREWRSSLGWIEEVDFSSEDYYEKCKNARQIFLDDEQLCLHYSNQNYNLELKKALSRIVIKGSSTNSIEIIENEDLDLDNESDEVIEWPYIQRTHNIFNKIKQFYVGESENAFSSLDILSGCIEMIDEMLSNIKLCMITTPSEEDAYKLFETLNDRSESVSDLELIKDYFYKTYTITSGEDPEDINYCIAGLDRKWKEDIFYRNDIKDRIAYCAAVLLSGNTNIKQNDIKRKSIKIYLDNYSKNDINKQYTHQKIEKDFRRIEQIKKIIIEIIPSESYNNIISYKVENASGHDETSIVKRALALAIHLNMQAVYAGMICDIIFTYEENENILGNDFNQYLSDIFLEDRCKNFFLGLWRDCNVIWKTIIMSSNYESPKVFGDKLIEKCNSGKSGNGRNVMDHIISFSTLSGENNIVEDDLEDEFEQWLNLWKFGDSNNKIKIKNLFIHLLNRYDKIYDTATSTNKLLLLQNSRRSFQDDSIKQDLDHMDAKKINENCAQKYFSYDNKGNRIMYVDSLGNMMPTPVKINRGKHNTPMQETINSYNNEGIQGWIFDEAKELFDEYHNDIGEFKIPSTDFFTVRQNLLIKYFVAIVRNQKENQESNIEL